MHNLFEEIEHDDHDGHHVPVVLEMNLGLVLAACRLRDRIAQLEPNRRKGDNRTFK
jgi:hypothetical protein